MRRLLALIACGWHVLGNDYDWTHQAGYAINELVSDFARLNFGLFNQDTLGVLALAAPLYCAARAGDDYVHGCCYDARHHKNLFFKGNDQCSSTILGDTLVGTFSIALPLYFLTRSDAEEKDLGSILLGGVTSIGVVKTFVKKAVTCHINYRPFSEKFKPKNTYGGFPSGHAAVLTYLTVLMGLKKGVRWAIPIGTYEALTLGLLVSCNYHYLSQIVAGAALGAIYAATAYKLANSKVSDRWNMGLGVTAWGNPAIQVTYDF